MIVRIVGTFQPVRANGIATTATNQSARPMMPVADSRTSPAPSAHLTTACLIALRVWSRMIPFARELLAVNSLPAVCRESPSITAWLTGSVAAIASGVISSVATAVHDRGFEVIVSSPSCARWNTVAAKSCSPGVSVAMKTVWTGPSPSGGSKRTEAPAFAHV